MGKNNEQEQADEFQTNLIASLVIAILFGIGVGSWCIFIGTLLVVLFLLQLSDMRVKRLIEIDRKLDELLKK